MRKFPFKKIDAFTTGSSAGNPAGIIYLNDASSFPSEKEMLKIAKELKGFVNEVVYVKSVNDNDISFSLLFYSSECEVDFCGHGTIAIMYDLIKNSDLINKDDINIKIKKGIITVYNEIHKTDAIYISAPSPKYIDVEFEQKIVVQSLNIKNDDVDSNCNIELINAGLNTLVVPLLSLDSCINLKPDFQILLEYCLKYDIDIVIIFTDDVKAKSNSFRTRVFAPRFGYLEDPATGSGNSALGYYLLKHKIWDGKEISIEQGTNITNPNVVKLKTINKMVLFGGSAVKRIEGDYFLH